MYNYREQIKADILDYIEENGCENMTYGELYDRLFIEDCVTGNASGSYTFSTYQAKENLRGNLMLLADAMTEFGYPIWIDGRDFDTCKVRLPREEMEHRLMKIGSDLYDALPDVNIWDKGAEWCDVTIRCYLLGECLSDVMKRL